MPRHNHFDSPANPLVIAGGATLYLPASGYYTNPCFKEIIFTARRIAAAAGTLDIEYEFFEPTLDVFLPGVAGDGAALKFVQWAAGAADGNGPPVSYQLIRLGTGITGAATNGVITVATKHKWFDYTPRQFWRLKLTAGAGAGNNTVYLGAQYLQGD